MDGICVKTKFYGKVLTIGSNCGEVHERCCAHGPKCIHPGLVSVGGYCKYQRGFKGRRYGASQCGGYNERICPTDPACLCQFCTNIHGYCQVPGVYDGKSG
jgi:hypothetical protein